MFPLPVVLISIPFNIFPISTPNGIEPSKYEIIHKPIIIKYVVIFGAVIPALLGGSTIQPPTVIKHGVIF